MTNGINRILCSIGMRGNCDNVIENGINLALATNASLDILFVVKSLNEDVMNTLKVNIRDRDVLGSLMDKRIEQALDSLKSELAAFWKRHPELQEKMQGREIELKVLEGDPASVIAHYAKVGNFDLIVMAANKRSYIATYAGRVTKDVIKRTKVPVVVVPVARP